MQYGKTTLLKRVSIIHPANFTMLGFSNPGAPPSPKVYTYLLVYLQEAACSDPVVTQTSVRVSYRHDHRVENKQQWRLRRMLHMQGHVAEIVSMLAPNGQDQKATKEESRPRPTVEVTTASDCA